MRQKGGKRSTKVHLGAKWTKLDFAAIYYVSWPSGLPEWARKAMKNGVGF